MAKKRILIVCDSPTLNTGYSRVGRFVADTLCKEYTVRYVPCNAENPSSGRKFPYLVYPFNHNDRYNVGRMGNILAEFLPSLVMVFGEFAYIAYTGNVCRDMGIRSMYYFPIEGRNFPPDVVYHVDGMIDYRLVLSKFHYIVAYSEFGKAEIHKRLPGIVTEVVPHQVNTDIFRPLDKERCFRIYLNNLADDPEVGYKKTFIVGAIYRNMRRKGIDILLRGFKEFLQYEDQDYRKAFLFLVMDPKDVYGFNLKDLIELYGLKGRIVLHPVVAGKAGPDDHALSELYNLFDVHCCTYRAEGFGINLLEGAACGVRTIATNFSTPAEYGKGVFDFVDPIDYEPVVHTNCEWAVLNPKDVAAKLLDLYKDESTKTHYTKGVELAAKFSEANVAKHWLELLRDINLPERVHVSDDAVAVAMPTEQEAVISNYLSVLDE